MARFFGKCLFLDTNLKFVEKLKKQESYLAQYPCVFARTLKESYPILKNNQHHIRAIFLSTNVSPSKGVDELKEIKQMRPHMPVILISHNPANERDIITADLGFASVLSGQFDFPEIIEVLNKLFANNDKWDDVQPSSEEKFSEIELADANYIPTPLKDFIVTSKSFFNIFIKIGNKKFIKILNAGDPIQRDFIDAYTAKGVKNLYISSEEQQKYTHMCDKISEAILKKAEVSTDKKLKSLLNFGTNISNNLNRAGITPEKLAYADSFLGQSLDLIRSMKLKNEGLKSLLVHIEKEHCSAVAFLAGLIAKEVGLESSKSVKLVGLAALVHDIGLYSIDPDFPHEIPVKFSPKEQELFERHTVDGANLLRKTGSFEEVVCLAVEQHHKRRMCNDSEKRSSNITLVSEIVGVADDMFNCVISEDSTPERINFFLNFNLKEFSPQIEKAILRIMEIDEKKKAG